tara:strand:- start:5 stop:139 length:135 start_codon:yes stop_codon:yes gene_type:complete
VWYGFLNAATGEQKVQTKQDWVEEEETKMGRDSDGVLGRRERRS